MLMDCRRILLYNDRYMRFLFVVFLLLMLGVLAASHLFIYATLVRFFAVASPSVKKLLAGAITFLASSFFFASLLIHWWENIATRSFYFLTGVWLGLVAVFIALAVVGWPVLLLGEKFSLGLSGRWLGGLIVAVSLLVTGYGIFNAGRPVTRELEVRMNNLPEIWRGKVVVQITDIHLGAVHRPDFIEKVIARVNELKPEMVFITGDYYDGMDGQLDELARPLNDIKAPRGVYFVTGNHETYLGLEAVFAALGKTRVKVLNDETATVDGLSVVGVGYPPFGERKSLTEVLNRLKPSRPAILLYHEPRQIEAAAASGLVDLMLMGHTHDGQVWPIEYISRLIYKKFVYGLYQVGDMIVYTSSGVGTWGPPLRTGNHPEIVAIRLE